MYSITCVTAKNKREKKSGIRETPNLSTYADSSTKIDVSAAVQKGADCIFFLLLFSSSRTLPPPSPPPSLLAPPPKGLFCKKKKGGGVVSNSEYLPVFRAPRRGEGRSAPVHRRGTLRTSLWMKVAPPRYTQKNCTGRGQTTHKKTDRHRDY